MEENEPTFTSVNPAPITKPDKPKRKIKLAWVVAVVMTLAAGVFAWLYFTKDTAAPVQPTETTNEAGNEDEVQDEEESSQTVYQAEIGKFRLSLVDTYGIVEKLDGNFEGGPATSIEIGQTSENTPGVIVSNPAQAFSIFARPEPSATLASNSRAAALEADELAERQTDITFADTAARVYTSDGLFIVKHIVFVKNGIAYEITLLNEDQAQADMLEAVEAGWAFVE